MVVGSWQDLVEDTEVDLVVETVADLYLDMVEASVYFVQEDKVSLIEIIENLVEQLAGIRYFE